MLRKPALWISLFLVLGVISFIVFVPNPFQGQVEALLEETGATFEVKRCSGGWISRSIHCEILISEPELESMTARLGLDEELPGFPGKLRLIGVDPEENPCSASLRETYSDAFSVQQWIPSRHGFAGGIFFYNGKTRRGCLFLSIASG